MKSNREYRTGTSVGLKARGGASSSCSRLSASSIHQPALTKLVNERQRAYVTTAMDVARSKVRRSLITRRTIRADLSPVERLRTRISIVPEVEIIVLSRRRDSLWEWKGTLLDSQEHKEILLTLLEKLLYTNVSSCIYSEGIYVHRARLNKVVV